MRLGSVLGRKARIAVAICFALLLLDAVVSWFHPASLLVDNPDGRAVVVVPWTGAAAIAVPCGHSAMIAPQHGGWLPWNVHVYEKGSGRLLESTLMFGPAAYQMVIRPRTIWMGLAPTGEGPPPFSTCQAQ